MSSSSETSDFNFNFDFDRERIENQLLNEQQICINQKPDIIDENELNQKIPYHRQYFEYVVSCIKKTVKCEDALIKQILYAGFSPYIEDDPINLGVIAPTSEGKTYAVTESLQYFPEKDIMYIGQMSPKVLVRQKGILINKDTGQPVENKIKELKTQIKELVRKGKSTKDRDEKSYIQDDIEKINLEIQKLYENSKTLIGLTGKILVFLEPPQYDLWLLLKPILSHDKREIEFPFVDKTAKSNAETKDVVVRGWPSCIYCSAKDESSWKIWPEIRSRILTTSPNMIPKKYKESNKLIAQRKGLPNIIQEQIIISDSEIDTAKKCVLLIKQKINELKQNNKNGKISLWIPYHDLLQELLPANKGTDVRFVKRVFALLKIVPIVKHDLRDILKMEGETSIVADLTDLKEVLSISNNLDGLPKFKAQFFNEILIPCYNKKTEPDSKIIKTRKEEYDRIVTEDIVAVTTRELADFYKKKKGKPITTDNVKQTYLNQFIKEGLLDYTVSQIHARENIYYPLVTQAENLVDLSIVSPIDYDTHESKSIYEKITEKITESWIFSEIEGLISCRLSQTNMTYFEYVNDKQKIQFWNNQLTLEEHETTKELQVSEESIVLSIEEFSKKYSQISDMTLIPIDNKRSSNIASFDKSSSNLVDSVHNRLVDKSTEETMTGIQFGNGPIHLAAEKPTAGQPMPTTTAETVPKRENLENDY